MPREALSGDELRKRRRERYLANAEVIKAKVKARYVPVASLSKEEHEARRAARRPFEKEWAKRRRKKDGYVPPRRTPPDDKRLLELREYYGEYRDKHRDELKEYHQKYRAEKRDALRVKRVAKLFEISAEEYDLLRKRQNGLCAICGGKETRRNRKSGKVLDLAVDHCHKAGHVRGLLCSNCNHGLGNFRDSEALLRKAIVYLSAL